MSRSFAIGMNLTRTQILKALEEAFFAARSHPMRMLLLVDSPTAFRERNIFVSADALMRV